MAPATKHYQLDVPSQQNNILSMSSVKPSSGAMIRSDFELGDEDFWPVSDLDDVPHVNFDELPPTDYHPGSLETFSEMYQNTYHRPESLWGSATDRSFAGHPNHQTIDNGMDWQLMDHSNMEFSDFEWTQMDSVTPHSSASSRTLSLHPANLEPLPAEREASLAVQRALCAQREDNLGFHYPTSSGVHERITVPAETFSNSFLAPPDDVLDSLLREQGTSDWNPHDPLRKAVVILNLYNQASRNMHSGRNQAWPFDHGSPRPGGHSAICNSVTDPGEQDAISDVLSAVRGSDWSEPDKTTYIRG
ncbi:hypothetical protein IAR55_004937 [Kwoniella newhampshirensis]|uniref:Uncharacterized protein n=1 Tax=Kwoniella newhampshirensis TaxID=1651941 RepID=A0AAW0YW87_9TREE